MNRSLYQRYGVALILGRFADRNAMWIEMPLLFRIFRCPIFLFKAGQKCSLNIQFDYLYFALKVWKSFRVFSSLSFSNSLIIVSTLDGKLIALDATGNGKKHWILHSLLGPLVSSSTTTVKVRKIDALGSINWKVDDPNRFSFRNFIKVL